MLSRQEAERLMFIHGVRTVLQPKKVPLAWYRFCDVMPATPADSRMVVNQLLAELKAEKVESK